MLFTSAARATRLKLRNMWCTGLIVMAKDAKTQWHLSDQFKAHTVSCCLRRGHVPCF